jgi:hypothetical protein
MPVSSTLSYQNYVHFCIAAIALIAACGDCYTPHRRQIVSFSGLHFRFNKAESASQHTPILNVWAHKNLRGGGTTGADRTSERLKEQPKPRRSSTVEEPEPKIEHQRSGIELFPELDSKQKELEGSLPMQFAPSPNPAAEPLVYRNRSAPASNPISDAEQHDLESIVCSMRDELIVNQVCAEHHPPSGWACAGLQPPAGWEQKCRLKWPRSRQGDRAWG